jgi:CubicO group peptidase (beta-lactamase class C family)
VFLDAFTGEITEDRYYHFLQTIQPQDRPAYSNIHFTLAGRIVAAVEKKSWRDALDERLLKPVGMTRTTGYVSRMYADPDSAVPLEDDGKGGWIPASPRKTDRTMHAGGDWGRQPAMQPVICC